MEMLKSYIQTLTSFSEESWLILTQLLTEEKIKKGQNILDIGQVCDSIYFINFGLCRAVFHKEGKEINTAFYFENDFMTNSNSLISGEKSEYQLQAIENMSILRLNKIKLIQAYQQSHEIETFGRKVLEKIITQQEEHHLIFKIYTPTQRYNYILKNNPHYLQRISLSKLASYLGLTRETLSRIRKKK